MYYRPLLTPEQAELSFYGMQLLEQQCCLTVPPYCLSFCNLTHCHCYTLHKQNDDDDDDDDDDDELELHASIGVRGDMIETYKILLGVYDTAVSRPLF